MEKYDDGRLPGSRASTDAPRYLMDVMQSDGVTYLHGTSSYALEGIAKLGGILPLDKMFNNPDFNMAQLKWGEHAHQNKKHKLTLADRTPSWAGVSMSKVGPDNLTGMHNSIFYYARIGNRRTGEMDRISYPVVFGINDRIPTQKHSTHDLSNGAIGIDNIVAVYIPDREQIADAKNRLAAAPRLAGRVKAMPELEPPSLTPEPLSMKPSLADDLELPIEMAPVL